MIAVVQRVKHALVKVEDRTIGEIGPGLLVFLGVSEKDSLSDIDFLSDKIVNLRILEDEKGKMNRSALEKNGEVLIVSQFTLLGDTRKGRRPSFVHAADPEKAEDYYLRFVEKIRKTGLTVQTGQFRAEMDVSLVNDGPVTLIVKSKNHDE